MINVGTYLVSRNSWLGHELGSSVQQFCHCQKILCTITALFYFGAKYFHVWEFFCSYENFSYYDFNSQRY